MHTHCVAFGFRYAYLPSALSKRSVQFIPVIGRGAKAMQVVYIDRRSAASRANGLERVKAVRDSTQQASRSTLVLL